MDYPDLSSFMEKYIYLPRVNESITKAAHSKFCEIISGIGPDKDS